MPVVKLLYFSLLGTYGLIIKIAFYISAKSSNNFPKKNFKTVCWTNRDGQIGSNFWSFL